MESKRLNVVWVFCIVFGLLLGLASCGNNTNGGTIEEPEITLDYLTGEFKEQLLRDGAEEVLGYLEILPDKDPLQVKIQEQAIVEDATSIDGYYIADKNRSISAWADTDTRTSYQDDNGKIQVMEITDLADLTKKDNDKYEGKLYDVFLMGDQVVLILAKEL